MVYISKDGQVLRTAPYGLRTIFAFFSGLIYMIIMFFRTLIKPGGSGTKGSQGKYSVRPGSGPPRPPRKYNTLPPPPMSFGGCKSCAM